MLTPFKTNTDPDRVIDLEAIPGADVRTCIYQALEVVRVIGGKVRFKHNGSELTIDGETTYADLYRQWHDNVE